MKLDAVTALTYIVDDGSCQMYAGGYPYLPEGVDVPVCKECGRHMQFVVSVPALTNLGQRISVFMCDTTDVDGEFLFCETWDANSGANAVILHPNNAPATQKHEAKAEPQVGIKPLTLRDVVYDDYLLSGALDANSEETTIGYLGDDTLRDGDYLQGREDSWNCDECGEPMRLLLSLRSVEKGEFEFPTPEFNFAGTGELYVFENACSHAGAKAGWQG